MERKSGVRVQYSLILSSMRKYFPDLNLSSALFGQCACLIDFDLSKTITFKKILNFLCFFICDILSPRIIGVFGKTDFVKCSNLTIVFCLLLSILIQAKVSTAK
jgi:hypothetical protein